ncbi:MAG: hypothetical protein HOH77_20395, partial [Candidatus Latescibacteria bacterium]|nr:hypothetical protein [Candidatus Latescibacterota bacterium]
MIPKVPLKVDHAIREVTAQIYRRRIMQGWFFFGCALLVLILGLGLAVELLVNSSIPLVVPFGLFGLFVFWSGYRWLWLPRQQGDISRVDVARFLDMHHPELDDLVLSSVSLGEQNQTQVSDWMVSEVLRNARSLGGAVISTSVITPLWGRGLRKKMVGIWATGLTMIAILIL